MDKNFGARPVSMRKSHDRWAWPRYRILHRACSELCSYAGGELWQGEEISSILGCSDGPGILIGVEAGSQQGDRLEGRVNLVCSCDMGGLEGTMRLDHLLNLP